MSDHEKYIRAEIERMCRSILRESWTESGLHRLVGLRGEVWQTFVDRMIMKMVDFYMFEFDRIRDELEGKVEHRSS